MFKKSLTASAVIGLSTQTYASESEVKNKILANKGYSADIEESSSFYFPQVKYSETLNLFEAARSGAGYFRIPALIKTKSGTLIAAADARYDSPVDWGNVATVVRTSTDGGKTWSPIHKILDLPSLTAKSGTSSAFSIDTALMEGSGNRVLAIFDMFPQSGGLFQGVTSQWPFYKEINGKKYRTLLEKDHPHHHHAPTPKDHKDDFYTLRDDGWIYDPSGNKTEYKVIIKSNKPPYEDLGDIYKDNTFEGNIYLYGAYKGKTSPYNVPKGNYLWMSYSDDGGLTWSSPEDIGANLKEKWMSFMGTGPGAGITTSSGRLVLPVYTAKFKTSYDYNTGSGFEGTSQSSRVIYSDDNGQTWKSGAAVNDGRIFNGEELQSKTMSNNDAINTESSVVQLNNGDLLLFMRNRSGVLEYSISKNEGETWGDVKSINTIKENHVQLSATHFNYGDKEYVLITNASGDPTKTGVRSGNGKDGSRTNGEIKVLEVNDSEPEMI